MCTCSPGAGKVEAGTLLVLTLQQSSLCTSGPCVLVHILACVPKLTGAIIHTLINTEVKEAVIKYLSRGFFLFWFVFLFSFSSEKIPVENTRQV